MVPTNDSDIQFIVKHLKDVEKTIEDSISVWEMGIEKGMVRTMSECLAGVDAVKAEHKKITLNGPQGNHQHKVCFVSTVSVVDF